MPRQQPQANLTAAAVPRAALPPSGLTAALQQQRLTQPSRLSAACLRPCPGARALTVKAAATRMHQTTAPDSVSAGSCRSQPVPVPTTRQAPPSVAPPPSPALAPTAVPAPSPAPVPAARDPRLLVREAAEKAKQLAAAAAIQKATGASAPTWTTTFKQEEFDADPPSSSSTDDSSQEQVASLTLRNLKRCRDYPVFYIDREQAPPPAAASGRPNLRSSQKKSKQ